jgi:hypothetical protein
MCVSSSRTLWRQRSTVNVRPLRKSHNIA